MDKYVATIGETSLELEMREGQEVTVNGRVYLLEFEVIEPGVLMLKLDSKSYRVLLESVGGGVTRARVLGRSFTVRLENELHLRLGLPQGRDLAGHAKAEVRAPMPGLVVAIQVHTGDRVQVGSTLLILEAMKMENEIRSLHDGTIGEVCVHEGSPVEKGELLLRFRN